MLISTFNNAVSLIRLAYTTLDKFQVPGKWIVSIHHFQGIAGRYIEFNNHYSIWEEAYFFPAKKTVGRKRSGFGVSRRATKERYANNGGHYNHPCHHYPNIIAG